MEFVSESESKIIKTKKKKRFLHVKFSVDVIFSTGKEIVRSIFYI